MRTHPETGRKCIYLGDHAEYIVGMPYDEGRALIEELNALAVHPDLTYEHRWKPGELIVWDNRCVMHRATAYDPCDARAGRAPLHGAGRGSGVESRCYRGKVRAGVANNEEKSVKPASIAGAGVGMGGQPTRAIAPPIHTSTTFIRDPDNQFRSGRTYARDHNPTFDQAEAVLTALEGGHASAAVRVRHGRRHGGVPGVGAGRSCAGAEGHVLVAAQLADELRDALGIARGVRRHVDPDVSCGARCSPAATKLVWIETPANPLWTITDIAATSEIAHAAGARARRRFDRRNTRAHAAAGARRGHRHAFRDQIPQRPLGRHRRSA